MTAITGTSAVLLAAKYCQQYPLFQWKEESLTCIGRKDRGKFRFRIQLTNLMQELERSQDMLLTIVSANSTNLQGIRRSQLDYEMKALLVSLAHPNILPVVDFTYVREKNALVIRPEWEYLIKYQHQRNKPLGVQEIAQFSTEIMRALMALRSKGIICESLHSGNILIDNKSAKLTDLYNTLFGLDRPVRLRDLMTPLEAYVEPDLIQFGHVIYEMATGLELASPRPDSSILDTMDPMIADVLRYIFLLDSRRILSKRTPVSITAPSSQPSSSELNLWDEECEGDPKASLSRLSEFPLFHLADLPSIESLFAGFRLDSGMKGVIRMIIRANQARNDAHVTRYREKESERIERQRVDRRLKLKQLQHSSQKNIVMDADKSKVSTLRRSSYRASAAHRPAP
ncbi:unnamed protein product [Albugo candida]|uniref:Protein kinase domain-containing protein n=3 Tax=Albugo candida TaxID=65357 RepID=A0A024G387_9STRA|nr:unnamed protein product [Albugo candida]|eukprot:CCI40774.1 unnamed protein product [Albugo candida]